MTIRQEFLRRIFNIIGIICLFLGFCYECRLLYVGTILVYFVETHAILSIVELYKISVAEHKGKK